MFQWTKQTSSAQRAYSWVSGYSQSHTNISLWIGYKTLSFHGITVNRRTPAVWKVLRASRWIEGRKRNNVRGVVRKEEWMGNDGGEGINRSRKEDKDKHAPNMLLWLSIRKSGRHPHMASPTRVSYRRWHALSVLSSPLKRGCGCGEDHIRQYVENTESYKVL